LRESLLVAPGDLDPVLQGGEIGDLGDDEDPGDVILNWAQLLMLSSLGVRSTVILGAPPTAAPIPLPILTSTERERCAMPRGEGERERRQPEKLFPL
jgi:hypothetical protein